MLDDATMGSSLPLVDDVGILEGSLEWLEDDTGTTCSLGGRRGRTIFASKDATRSGPDTFTVRGFCE